MFQARRPEAGRIQDPAQVVGEILVRAPAAEEILVRAPAVAAVAGAVGQMAAVVRSEPLLTRRTPGRSLAYS